MVKVGIYGASGYTGQELLRFLVRHPQAEAVALTSRAYKGTPVADVYPLFKGLTDLVFIDASPEQVAAECDVVFLAVPHGEAMEAAPVFYDRGLKIIDLSADFRLRDIALYESWYKVHTAPALVEKAVYGLPELYRDEIRKTALVANPGCYPTGAILGLAPLLKGGHIQTSPIIVDSKSGVSGAGRNLQIGSLFCEVNEGFRAYKIGSHRHTPEIDQELSLMAGSALSVTFVPHLLPVNRGILSTMYVELSEELSVDEIFTVFDKFYHKEPFVRLYRPGQTPDISSVRGSNFCDIGFVRPGGSRLLIVVAAIDNLVKGAAGQAIQNMNIMCGFPETAGLDVVSLYP